LRDGAASEFDNLLARRYNRLIFVEGRTPLRTSTVDKKRLEYYKKKLQTRREELVKAIARTGQEGREADEDPTVDLADKAANSYTKEFLFGQTHNDRALLQLVDEALTRIREGTFGQCVQCGEELQQKRLEAVPWTRYCINCQEKQEQGLL
jgi:RNA polymerase-binding transcription factor